MTAVTISFAKPDGTTLVIEQAPGQDHYPRYAIRLAESVDDPFIEDDPDAFAMGEVSNLDAGDARSLRDALTMLLGPDVQYTQAV